MKNINKILISIVLFVLLLISFSMDLVVSSFFKNYRFFFLDFFFAIITNILVIGVVMLIIPSFIFYKKNKKLIYYLWSTYIISFILAAITKLILQRQRPVDVDHIVNIINYIDYYSFPSMHAMVVFSLLPILIKYLPKLRYFWILFVILVASSRIYFNFHFLSDVVAGSIVGYFVGYTLLNWLNINTGVV